MWTITVCDICVQFNVNWDTPDFLPDEIQKSVKNSDTFEDIKIVLPVASQLLYRQTEVFIADNKDLHLLGIPLALRVSFDF